MARVRRAAARHRRAHQLRAAPQALVLPDQERRSARLRAGRDRNRSRWSRAITARRRRSAGTTASAQLPPHAPRRWSGRSPRSCGWPKASIAATRRRSPASSCTTAATMRCCRCARRATPSSSSGRRTRHAAPFERLIGKPLRVEVSGHAYVEQPDASRTSTRASCSSSRGSTGRARRRSWALLAKWLSAEGHRVFVTEWNSSVLVKAATKTGKKKNALTPMTFSLLHATDFADRLLYKIIPPLKAGMIVLADRYAYTAFARDATRGVDRAVGARALQLRRAARSGALLPRADRGLARSADGAAREAEVLRGRAWTWAGAPTRSRAFGCFRARCSTSTIGSSSEFGLEVVDAARQHHRAAAARPRAGRAAPARRATVEIDR